MSVLSSGGLPPNAMHWVAHDIRGQRGGQAGDDGVLHSIAILILVDKDARIGRLQYLIKMPSPQQREGSCTDGGVVIGAVRQQHDCRVVATPAWEPADQLHGEPIKRGNSE
ncbi:hypothetical protein PL963_04062 [Pseudomonas cerasi]|uniref:Uncharacterized protein n=1 Tax=Pseudomonas cerasi TaxID=1583341 RepID=A0A2K4VES1_9PSED|nr:hypothetical protein PL963_04062 [Pseudomonas cerasi]